MRWGSKWNGTDSEINISFAIAEGISSPSHSNGTTESYISSPSSLEINSSKLSLQSSHPLPEQVSYHGL